VATNNTNVTYRKEYKQRPEVREKARLYAQARRDAAKANGTPIPRGGKTQHVSKFDQENIYAIDTEGAEINGHHTTILMQIVGKKDPISGLRFEDSLQSPNGFNSQQLLWQLCEWSKHLNDPLFTMFSASYDWTMFLKDLFKTRKSLINFRQQTLHSKKSHPTYAHRFNKHNKILIAYMPRKQLRITHFMRPTTQTEPYTKENNYGWDKQSSFTLWDVWGFFQGKFIDNAIQYLGDTYSDMPLIIKGKEQRSEFIPTDMPFIQQYCRAECIALVEMMLLFFSYVRKLDVKLSRFDGAGALAAAIYDRYETLSAMGDILPEIRRASCFAYSGGRSELLWPGHTNNPIYRYDINSAYVKGISQLPNFTRGQWVNYQREDNSDKEWWKCYIHKFAVFHIRWNNMDKKDGVTLYPFSVRTAGNNILFPPMGQTWVWSHELAAYAENADAYGKHYFACAEVWVFEEEDITDKPFSFVETLYIQRQEWKSAFIQAQLALKLGLNSLYGKMAQNVGGTDERPPKYFNLEWAGAVTSYTRATIYRACMLAPHDIIMIATDGIFSRVPLPLPISNKLGEFEYTYYENGTFAQAGVYWTKEPGQSSSGHFRGYSDDYKDGDKPLTEQRIIDHWRSGTKTKLQIDARRAFIGLGHASQSDTFFASLGQWVESTKELDADKFSTKRNRVIKYRSRDMRTANMADELVPTKPVDGLMTGQLALEVNAGAFKRGLINEDEAIKLHNGIFEDSKSMPHIPAFASEDNPIYTQLFELQKERRKYVKGPEIDYKEMRLLELEAAD